MQEPMDWTSAGLAKVERDGGSEASSSPYRPLFCNLSVLGGAFTFGVDATFEEALQGVSQNTTHSLESLKCHANWKRGSIDVEAPRLPSMDNDGKVSFPVPWPAFVVTRTRGLDAACSTKRTLGVDFSEDVSIDLNLKQTVPIQGSLALHTKAKILAKGRTLKALSQKATLKLRQGSSVAVSLQVKKGWERVCLPIEANLLKRGAGPRSLKLSLAPCLCPWGPPKLAAHAKGLRLLSPAVEEFMVKVDKNGAELRVRPKLLPALEVCLSAKSRKPKSLKFCFETGDQSALAQLGPRN